MIQGHEGKTNTKGKGCVLFICACQISVETKVYTLCITMEAEVKVAIH